MAKTASTPKLRLVQGYGRQDLRPFPTKASQLINLGDALWQDTNGLMQSANFFTWDTDLATTQPEFRAKFMGVAMENKIAGDASQREILVATLGFFDYDCAALGSAVHAGTFINLAKDASNNSLADQIIATVSGITLGIGKTAREAALGATIMRVQLQSFLLFGGVAV